jgi:integrase
VPLDEITAGQIEAFLGAERARVATTAGHDGGPTAIAAYNYLSAFYHWADRRDLLGGARSPMNGISRPAALRKVVPVPHQDQLHALLAVMGGKSFADRRDTALVRLACELGGPRRGELAALRVQDVDLRRGSALLHGKGGKQRVIPLSGKTAEALMRYLAARKRHPRAATTEAMWLGARGGALTGDAIRRMTARRAEQAGTGHIHPHMFRHYAAAMAKRNKVPTAAAKALFGWDTALMYDTVYGAWSDADDAAVLARELAIGDQL